MEYSVIHVLEARERMISEGQTGAGLREPHEGTVDGNPEPSCTCQESKRNRLSVFPRTFGRLGGTAADASATVAYGIPDISRFFWVDKPAPVEHSM